MLTRKNLHKCITHTIAVLLVAIPVFTSCYSDNIDDAIELENITSKELPPGDPAPGNLGIITTTEITSSSIRILWTKATDDFTDQSDLEYCVFISNANNISTVKDAEKYGKPISGWNLDFNDYTVPGLSPGIVFYINVLVRDEDDKKSSYINISVTTKPTTGQIYLFSAGTSTGDLVDAKSVSVRDDVDKICSGSAAFKALPCTKVRAFISVSKSDTIAKLSDNYSIPATWKITSSGGNKVADNWFALLKGPLEDELQDLGVASSFWWSGSLTDGSYDTGSNCGSWSIGDNSSKGRSGAHNRVTSEWIQSNDRNCNNSLHVLCMCW